MAASLVHRPGRLPGFFFLLIYGSDPRGVEFISCFMAANGNFVSRAVVAVWIEFGFLLFFFHDFSLQFSGSFGMCSTSRRAPTGMGRINRIVREVQTEDFAVGRSFLGAAHIDSVRVSVFRASFTALRRVASIVVGRSIDSGWRFTVFDPGRRGVFFRWHSVYIGLYPFLLSAVG